MRVENLLQWLREAKKEKAAEATEEEVGVRIEMETGKIDTYPLPLYNWHKVVDLIQADFKEIWLVEDTMCQVMVLIPKGGGVW